MKEWVQNIPPTRVARSDAILTLTLGVAGQQMDNAVTASPSLNAITESPPEEDVLHWINMGTGIPVYIGGGRAAENKKKRASPSLHGARSRPPGGFQACKETPQNWFKTYHPPWSAWLSLCANSEPPSFCDPPWTNTGMELHFASELNCRMWCTLYNMVPLKLCKE